MEPVSTHYVETLCPDCGHKLDTASSFEGYRPKAGDILVCINCGAVLQFDREFRLYKMTDEELAALGPEERADIRQLQRNPALGGYRA